MRGTAKCRPTCRRRQVIHCPDCLSALLSLSALSLLSALCAVTAVRAVTVTAADSSRRVTQSHAKSRNSHAHVFSISIYNESSLDLLQGPAPLDSPRSVPVCPPVSPCRLKACTSPVAA